jgi:azurin
MYLKAMTIAAMSLAGSVAMAADCSFTIEANDQMQYNAKEITIPGECAEFEVTLVHVGKLPKATMGHGFVVTKTSDLAALSSAGMAAGAANSYVAPGDARAIAMIPLVGGGEKGSVKIDTSKLEKGGDYSFYCPFPGHFAVMKGKLIFG